MCSSHGKCPASSLDTAVLKVRQIEHLVLVKEKVIEGNSNLEISSVSFIVLYTPTLPRNRCIGKKVGGGEVLRVTGDTLMARMP